MHTCKKSINGRALARFFCGLLIGSDVGINAKWISTEANKIADEISRVKKSNHSTHSSTCYDLSKLKQELCGIETLSFLPPESRAALYALGNYVDAKMSRLKHGAEVETKRFRQAQYINWCKLKLIPDPCGCDRGYERIVACFAENLIMDCNSRSATVQAYVTSINTGCLK
jgi:hypothetical protein